MPANAPRRRGRPPSGQPEAILAATLALLRERGIAQLTTREVAARAGVSEASVYYHFKDRFGLLRAVLEQGMDPLRSISELPGTPPAAEPAGVLAAASRALERFFDEVFPVLMAAQADPELHAALSAHLAENDLGPHRGVQAIGGYLRAQQAAGRLDAAIDCDSVALMLIGSCLVRVLERQAIGRTHDLPSTERVASALQGLLGSG